MTAKKNTIKSFLRKKDDIIFKSAFEEAFPDLLRFFFPDADEVFDMEKKFEFLDKELGELFPELEHKGGSRFVDMLVKVFLKDGTEEWILIHIEIQGNNDRSFPHRMLQYWYRIYDRFQVNITALAIFTGNKHQKIPDRFYKSFMGTKILYEYNVYHILDHTEEQLLEMGNPFALIVLAAQKALLRGKVPEEELGRQRLTVAKALIESKKYNHEQIAKFLYFLKNFLHIENPEINRNFDTQINRLTGKKISMGIIETIKQIEREKGREEGSEKGREEGREEGIEIGRDEAKELVIKNLLSITDLTMSRIADIADVSLATVRRIKKEMNN